jgi:alpha-glucosidase
MLKKDMTKAHHGIRSIHDLDSFADGEHPFLDRDEVHDIYIQWRKVFNEYDPPRMGVAEAWVPAHRRARYAEPDGLGHAFNFDLLRADFDAEQFRAIITRNLAEAAATSGSSTWVFSNHDVVRHATRYGVADAREWLLAGGDPAQVDTEKGRRRARAATLLMLALPGSAYLYQGEELGLPEVGQIPDQDRQDPTFIRNTGVDVGRDGCRVPLPWEPTGPSLGFGAGVAHLPQPTWFADYAVSVQETNPRSTLAFYRRALTLRHDLQSAQATLEWLDTSQADVLHFRPSGGWHVMTNFGPTPIPLPPGETLLASEPIDGTLPGEATAWIRG